MPWCHPVQKGKFTEFISFGFGSGWWFTNTSPVHIQSNPVPFGSSTAVCYVVGNSPLGVCTERETPRYIVGVNRITYPESFCIFVVLGNFIIIIIRGSAAEDDHSPAPARHSRSGAKAGEYYIIHFIWCVCKILPRRTIKRWWWWWLLEGVNLDFC